MTRDQLLEESRAAAVQAELAAQNAQPGFDAIVTGLVSVALAVAAGVQEPEQQRGEVPEVADGWYRIELMGHRRRHGHLRAVKLAGRQLVEIAYPVPLVGVDGEPSGSFDTKVERYATGAIFSLAESSEDEALEDAADRDTIPF